MNPPKRDGPVMAIIWAPDTRVIAPIRVIIVGF